MKSPASDRVANRRERRHRAWKLIRALNSGPDVLSGQTVGMCYGNGYRFWGFEGLKVDEREHPVINDSLSVLMGR